MRYASWSAGFAVQLLAFRRPWVVFYAKKVNCFVFASKRASACTRARMPVTCQHARCPRRTPPRRAAPGRAGRTWRQARGDALAAGAGWDGLFGPPRASELPRRSTRPTPRAGRPSPRETSPYVTFPLNVLQKMCNSLPIEFKCPTQITEIS